MNGEEPEEPMIKCCPVGVTYIMLICTACESKLITGTVTNSYGTVVDAAEVKIAGSAFSSSTDENGAFTLDYAPGTFAVQVSKPGYMPSSIDLTLTQKAKYPLGAVTLRKLPPHEEAAIEGAADLVPLPSGRLDERMVPQRVNVGGFGVNTTCAEAIVPRRVAKIELTDQPLRAFIPRSAGSRIMLLHEQYGRFFSAVARDRSVTCDASLPKRIPTTVVELPDYFFVEVKSLESARYCFLVTPDGALHTAMGYCFMADRMDEVRFLDNEPAPTLRPTIKKLAAAARRHDCAALASMATFPLIIAQETNLVASLVFTSLGDDLYKEPISIDRVTFERECPTSELFKKIGSEMTVGVSPFVRKNENGVHMGFPGVYLEMLEPEFRLVADSAGGIHWSGIGFQWSEPDHF